MSNTGDEIRRAQRAYDAAKEARVTGEPLGQLKAVLDAALAKYNQETGQPWRGGILS